MKGTIVMFCLIGAVFANPISHSALLESSELDPNTTESLSVSQSAENNTSELQSSEENTSSQSQSSESESLESTSEDKTSEESNSQSDEDDETDSMAETRDDSMGSEENMRKSWVRVFASVIKVQSAEDNSSSSAEVKGQPDHLTNTSADTSAAQGRTNLLRLEDPTDSSDTTSDSADTSELPTAASSSSESNETSETSETSDSSDSSEMQHIRGHDCVNGTQSCESEEYFFQDIGDDGQVSVDNAMVPEVDDREFSLRRR
ncbi:secretory calcium-binding phosphoprotein 1 [Chaetodon trifascialis]|uniref:secretory calcium-binding phosphoprotein 1 n=1 Tax=Chaetodon trifascialis TaxID=109706 RepID=UPI003991232E